MMEQGLSFHFQEVKHIKPTSCITLNVIEDIYRVWWRRTLSLSNWLHCGLVGWWVGGLVGWWVGGGTHEVVHLGEVLGRGELEGAGELHHLAHVDARVLGQASDRARQLGFVRRPVRRGMSEYSARVFRGSAATSVTSTTHGPHSSSWASRFGISRSTIRKGGLKSCRKDSNQGISLHWKK